MRRATITDIARAVGVSKGTVSFALNNRPGVSAGTRERVLQAAADLGWRPSSAARALSHARSGAVGLVLARSPQSLSGEQFYMQLLAGIEETLSAHEIALMLQLASSVEAEVEIYQRWWAERHVDAVLVTDMQVDDARVLWLQESGMPCVVIGPPQTHDLPAVWSDDALAMTNVVDYLAALGHTRIARVGGPATLVHTEVRTRAFESAAAAVSVEARSVTTDYTDEQGARATRSILAGRRPPTAIVYDNDLMAFAGLSVTGELGLRVPADLSIVAWDDSVLCRLSRPALTAVARDIPGFGSHAAELLLRVLAEGYAGRVEDATPYLVPRDSTAAPQRATN